MREAFALQKLLISFQQKYLHISDINIRNFNETVTNHVVSFENRALHFNLSALGISDELINDTVHFQEISKSAISFLLNGVTGLT